MLFYRRVLTLRCAEFVWTQPLAYLSDRFAEHAGVVRFSGTVSPLPLYQRLHGQICAPQERAESPFSADQALVMVVPDITYLF